MLGISGEGGPQLGVGEGRQEREGFLRTGLEEEDVTGRSPSGQMPGLLSLLKRLVLHPPLSPRELEWGGAASRGSLSCSHILSRRVG